MSIPFNDSLLRSTYNTDPDWYKYWYFPTSEVICNPMAIRSCAMNELAEQVKREPFVRGEQFVRDLLRLIFKVSIRSIRNPIIFERNWKVREQSLINLKLTGYSFVQLVSIPVKFMVALTALATMVFSLKYAKRQLDASRQWTQHLDGRASQLEALKEEGCKKASSKEDFLNYKNWLYKIDPRLCR